MKNKYAVLSELATELGINKSQLLYWSSVDLICPDTTLGRMGLYDRDKVLEQIKQIQKLRAKGLKINEIKKLITN